MRVNAAIVTLVAGVLITGCVGFSIDRETETFDRTSYWLDLGRCGGRTTLTATYDAAKQTLAGSAAGAVLGGAVGLGTGTFEAVKSSPRWFEECLVKRGYEIKKS